MAWNYRVTAWDDWQHGRSYETPLDEDMLYVHSMVVFAWDEDTGEVSVHTIHAPYPLTLEQWENLIADSMDSNYGQELA